MKKREPVTAEKAFSEALDRNTAAFFKNLAAMVPYPVFGVELGISATRYDRLLKLIASDRWFERKDEDVAEEIGVESFLIEKLRQDEAYPRLEALLESKMERFRSPSTFREELLGAEAQQRLLIEAQNLAYFAESERIQSDQTSSLTDRIAPTLHEANIEENVQKTYNIETKLLIRMVKAQPELLKELLPEEQVKELVAEVIEGEVIEEDG